MYDAHVIIIKIIVTATHISLSSGYWNMHLALRKIKIAITG
jgi:hypothetical protein